MKLWQNCYRWAVNDLKDLENIQYLGYHGRSGELAYWRTKNGIEIDAVLGDADIGLEIKSSTEVKDSQLKGLRSFGEDYQHARLIAVSNDMYRRRKDRVEIIPVKEFLADLWAGKII